MTIKARAHNFANEVIELLKPRTREDRRARARIILAFIALMVVIAVANA